MNSDPTKAERICGQPYFWRGKKIADGPRIGVVGARKASLLAREIAFSIGREITMRGGNLVSGGAYGIDHAAELGSLSVARPCRGAVVSVMPMGLFRAYPHRFASHFEAIASKGALLSLHRNAVSVRPFRFVERNQFLAQWIDKLVVIQAASKSGSLMTLRLAGELEKPVAVFSGMPQDQRNAGAHAALSADSTILGFNRLEQLYQSDFWPWNSSQSLWNPVMAESFLRRNPEEICVWQALGLEPKSLDAIASSVALEPSVVLRVLTRMKGKGAAVYEEGGWRTRAFLEDVLGPIS